MDKIFQSVAYQTAEHVAKVAIFTGMSAFTSEIIAELAGDQTVTSFVSHNVFALSLIGTVNLALAGAVKFLNLKKQEAMNQPIVVPSKVEKPKAPEAAPQTTK